jgi:CheY-like chemotaxis protein
MESGPPHPPVVLVCDDTESIRHLIRVNLESEGYAVEESTDGYAVVERLLDGRAARPALVVIDAAMGPYDGWWAVDRIRAEPTLDDVPIIMVTASVQDQERDQARTAGCDAFLAKPFDPDTLLDLVVRFVGAPGPRTVGS